jgi:predicted PurR-regulated permease PerM
VALPEDPTQMLSQAAQTVLGFVAPRLGGAVADIAGMLGSLFVMLFALFFLLRDRDRVIDLVRRLLPFPPAERERLIKATHNLVIASVGAGLAVAATQGLLGGIAFWALGLAAPAAWGVAIGICSLVPVVGAALIWVPLAGWWALSGDVLRALILVGVGAGVISMADNVLRPLLLSGRASVNGLVVFIGILGGVSAFGYVGLVLGPVVLALAGTRNEALTRSALTAAPLIEAPDE